MANRYIGGSVIPNHLIVRLDKDSGTLIINVTIYADFMAKYKLFDNKVIAIRFAKGSCKGFFDAVFASNNGDATATGLIDTLEYDWPINCFEGFSSAIYGGRFPKSCSSRTPFGKGDLHLQLVRCFTDHIYRRTTEVQCIAGLGNRWKGYVCTRRNDRLNALICRKLDDSIDIGGVYGMKLIRHLNSGVVSGNAGNNGT